MGVHDYTLYRAIRRAARLQKDRIALICGQERVTYSEFLHKVDILASGLTHAGIEAGDRVAVLAKNSLEHVYLYGAASKTGSILLPINWRLNPSEVEYVLKDGSPKILLADPEFQPTISPLISRSDFLSQCYSTGDGDGKFKAFQDLMAGDSSLPEAVVGELDGFAIIHTAAVSGKARGAVLTQRGLATVGMQLMYRLALSHRDVSLVALPLFHVFGLLLTVTSIMSGGASVIAPRFDVSLILESVKNDKITVFGEFAPMLQSLLDGAEKGGYDLSCLRHVVGIDLPETIERFQKTTGGTFWAVYGQSETSGLTSAAPYTEKPGSAGRPFEFAEVEIVDDAGNCVAPGIEGEIVTRGPTVFAGYWNLEKETAYTFRDGWHHTGDLGRLDEDGYLWFAGRAPEKELIKSGGENVYPAEVEEALLEHADIREAVVIGVPDVQWGEAIKAVCVRKDKGSVSEAALIEFVAERIARFKKPKHVVFVDALPKSESGAVDRQKVKADHGDA